MEEIYVYILNEGVDVWRPVHAMRVGVDVFRIEGPAMPEDEEWEFPVGTVVKVGRLKLDSGVVRLVAESRREP